MGREKKYTPYALYGHDLEHNARDIMVVHSHPPHQPIRPTSVDLDAVYAIGYRSYNMLYVVLRHRMDTAITTIRYNNLS